jgi:hypothetical protein
MSQVKLESLLRAYFIHWPYGHGMSDYHPNWKRGQESWDEIISVSSKLCDDHKTLNYLKEKLKAEGTIKGL